MEKIMKGMIGKKVGMTQLYDTKGNVIPVTVIEAGPCYVTQIRTGEKDGYSAIQLGFGAVKPERLSKGELGHLQKKNLPALRVLREFRVKQDDAGELSEGAEIKVDVFAQGDKVDVIGTSKGRGWAGAIKRHGFHRQKATHGASDRERAPGSVGMCALPGRTPKGKRMAGHYGDAQITTQNLEVVRIDAEKNLLAVRGSVPGVNGGIVIIRAAVKQPKK
jgi:large subunit ribosomal protein L3